LQTKEIDQDREGNLISQWSDWKKVWASVKPFKAKQGMHFQIRYFSEIPKEMRVMFGGDVYEVKSKLNLNGRHQHIQLFCQEVTYGD
jgi:SPP1 family predicted phage head-tail adaptor